MVKLNFASCVVHQTRSLDVLILYLVPGISFYDMVVVNQTYDIFHY